MVADAAGEGGAGRVRPLILRIKGNSLDDGPGIRSVLFFKGCPLRCAWCHNPESQRTEPELSFDGESCVGCGRCEQVCPRKAIRLRKPERIDRNKCDDCFACADACPGGALERVGTPATVEEVVEAVLVDKPFFDASGGGVTLSGGEPTLHLEFAGRIARALKGAGVHVLLETCGHFRWDAFERNLLPWLDEVYFDVKLVDPGEHRRWCGVGNELILENLAKLVDSSVPMLPRVPLVPGVTDAEENLRAISSLFQGLGLRRVALLPYNPTWHGKARALGRRVEFKRDSFLTKGELARARDCFHAFEVVA